MVELEQRLTGLGTTLTFPAPTHWSTTSWRRSLRPARRAASAPRGCRRAARGRAAVAAVPDARHAVARWLGFESLRIEVVERIPPELSAGRCSAGRADHRDGAGAARRWPVREARRVGCADHPGRRRRPAGLLDHRRTTRAACTAMPTATCARRAWPRDTLVWQDGDVIRRSRGRHLPRPSSARDRHRPAEGDAEHPRVAFPMCPTPRFGPRCSRWRRCPPTASASSRRSSTPSAAATRT